MMNFPVLSAEWTSAIFSGIAILFTGYTLWDTRKNVTQIQSQVNSLARLAETYEKSRRDDIMPYFKLRELYYNRGIEMICGVSFINDGQIAIDVSILCAEFEDFYKLPVQEILPLVVTDKLVTIPFSLQGIEYEDITNHYPFKLRIGFYNKDKEYFIQELQVDVKGKYRNFPPALQNV